MKRLGKQTIRLALLLCHGIAFQTATLAEFEGPWPPISQIELEKIEKAVPAKAAVMPKKTRRLLVFSRGTEANHKSTPHGMKALELMGQKTGAFEVTLTYDPDMLKAKSLAPFDALVLNNSNRLEYLNDPEIREGILGFVRQGKGFVGIHAATTNFVSRFQSDWPEGAEMLCGIFAGHPWHETVTVEVEEPEHPLCKAFHENSFEINDEIYQFSGPYSREKVRVLLSLDRSNTTIGQKHIRKIRRKDLDFPISWIRPYGKGRVFYSSLGHNSHIFWDSRILQHYLDGIQYALGDLEADAAPSAERDRIPLVGTEMEKIANLLEDLSDSKPGNDMRAKKRIEHMMRNRLQTDKGREATEQRYLSFLRSNATLEAKQFVIQQLSHVASDKSISTLSSMLYDDETAAMARNALEQIPGDTSKLALEVASSAKLRKEKSNSRK